MCQKYLSISQISQHSHTFLASTLRSVTYRLRKHGVIVCGEMGLRCNTKLDEIYYI